jgi:pimeloyl-ACP methyl ester carboxylesterase
MVFFQAGGLAEAAFEQGDFALLEKLWRDWAPGWRWPPEELEAVKALFRQPGVVHAALEYYRCFLRPWRPGGLETLRLLRTRMPVATLALTGADDGCLDTRLYDRGMRPEDFPAGLRVVRLSDCGHFLHREKPQQVNELLLEWLE